MTREVICFAGGNAMEKSITHFTLNTKPFVVIRTPYFSIVASSPEPTSQMRLKSPGLTYTKFDREYFPGRALFAATVSCTVAASAIALVSVCMFAGFKLWSFLSLICVSDGDTNDVEHSKSGDEVLLGSFQRK